MDRFALLREKLARLELRLQTLVEGSAARLFPNSNGHGLDESLLAALHAGSKPEPSGQAIAPDRFTLTVHPAQAEAMYTDSSLLAELTELVRQAGKEAGYVFLSPPVLIVYEDERLDVHQVQIVAEIGQQTLSDTTDLDLPVDTEPAPTPGNAFLIVNGTEVFPLQDSVINIGRRADNQLVIDDPRVSREHAQLRAVKGHYVIFDLNSTGGTFVNDTPVTQSVLFPGDVISLAGVPMVFGQDPGRLGETQKFDAA
jgi:hypothetical protein